MSLTRRQFLGASAAAVVAAGTLTKGTVFGASDRIGVCCIGLHGRGESHMIHFSTEEGSEVVALCDVDEKVLEQRAGELEKATKKRPKTYTDIREALEDPEVHAISIAMPNHWHTLATIWGMQAGKDVYVEKPISQTLWEGRQLADLYTKSDRIVQHGTQNRSDGRFLWAIDHMRQGIIGDIHMARGLCFKRRESIGFGKPGEPPAHLHWDLWQGPAPDQPFLVREDGAATDGVGGLFVHYNWHWFWTYGNGDIGNQGIHQMDVAAWGMNKGLPTRVHSVGGRYGYKDQGQTPNTQVATLEYADGTLTTFEVRGRATNDEDGLRIGNLFYGSKGYAFVPEEANKEHSRVFGFYDFDDKLILAAPDRKDKDALPPTKGPWGNFLEAIRKRDKSLIHGNPEEAHISAAHFHLANISYRLGRELHFDPKTETFVGDEEANRLLTREYRKGFEVPKTA